MNKIIIHRRKSGKYDYTITGDDVNQNIISHSVQGYGSRGETVNAVEAVREALTPGMMSPLAFTYMTHAQYTEFMRKHRNQLRRNRRSRARK